MRAGLCVSRAHYEVTVEHVFAKLLGDPQVDLSMIHGQFKFEAISLKQALDQTLRFKGETGRGMSQEGRGKISNFLTPLTSVPFDIAQQSA